MCRMIVAPLGIPGQGLVAPFLRMAQGLNDLNEVNQSLGAVTHGHGWGAVFRGQEGEDKCIRSVTACWEDEGIQSLSNETVFLLHARMASLGSVIAENVHPFRAAVDDHIWSFCHNGTVNQSLKQPPSLFGSDHTDSEILFHQWLELRNRRGVIEGLRVVYRCIHDYTGLNTFLLGAKALWVICRHATTPNYFTLHLSMTHHGPVISSEPLEELGSSRALPNGQILRIDRRDGSIDEFTL